MNDPPYQRQCLEMTLESSVGELSNLRELETLNVRHMAHRIRVAESECMATSWPRLRRINWLLEGCVDPVPWDLEWIRNNRLPWIPPATLEWLAILEGVQEPPIENIS